MNKISNEQALSFIDSFLGKVEWKKAEEKKAGEVKAEESPITVKSSDLGGVNLAGTETAKTGAKTDTSPGNLNKEEKAKEGEHGKEKSSDLAAAIPSVGVESSKAENNESKDKDRASVGDFGAEPTNDGGKDLAKEIQNSKVAGEKPMQQEIRRAENLGNKILQKYAAAQESQKAENLLKTAAEEAYHDFVISYQYGLLKRAEDEASIAETLNITAAEASQMLDEIAAENPEAVMPAEAMPEGEMPPEAAEGAPAEALPEEAAPVADAEGMPAEGGAGEEGGEGAAQEMIEALTQLGVTPEEIIEAAQEMEGGAGAEGAEGMPPEGMPAEMPPEAMAPEGMPPEGMPPEAMAPEGMPPEGMPVAASEQEALQTVINAMPKTAEDRKAFLKEVITNFRASHSK